MSQVQSEVLEQLEQQQTLIAQLKHLVRQNEEELKDKEKQLEESNSKFRKLKLQSRAKINQLTNQMKDGAKDKDDESEDSSTHSAESSDQGSRAKVLLLKKQMEDSRLRYEKQEQNMKDQIQCLQSTVQQLSSKEDEPVQVSRQSDGLKNEPQLEKGQQELYAQIVYKDSKILDLNNQILELEGKIMDLQETVREKDQVLQTRNKAIQLMTEEMNRRGQSVAEELNETRREMREMQERFASAESNWHEEKSGLQELLQTVKEDESQQMQKELKNFEAARFDLAKRNAELQEKVVHLQERIQEFGKYQEENTQSIENLQEELTNKDQIIEDLKKSSQEAASTTDNRILKARAKERSKLKVAERQIEELKKTASDHQKEQNLLQETLNAANSEKALLEDRISKLELSRNEITSKQENNQEVNAKELEAMSMNLKDTQEKVVVHVTRIADLEMQLAETGNTITELENKVKSLTEDKSTVEAQLEQIRNVVTEREKAADEQKAKVRSLTDFNTALESRLKELFSLVGVESEQDFNLQWTKQQEVISNLNAKCEESENKIMKKESLLNDVLLEKEKINEKLDQLQRDTVQYRNKITQMETYLTSLEEGSSLLSNEKEEKEFENESLKKKLNIKEKRIASLEEQLQLSLAAVKEVEATKSGLDKSLKEIFHVCGVTSVDDFRSKWDSTGQTVKNLLVDLEGKVKLLSDQEASFNVTISELKEQKNELGCKIKSLSFELEEKVEKLKALEEFKDISSQESQSKESQYLEQFSTFQNEITALRQSAHEMETYNSKCESTIESLNEKIKCLESDLQESRTVVSQTKDEFASELAGVKQSHGDEKQQLNLTITTLETQIDNLKAYLEKLRDETKEMSLSLEEKQSEIQEAQMALRTSENENITLKQHLSDAETRLSLEQSTNQSVSNEISALQNEIESLQFELHSKQLMLENEQKDICSLQTQLREQSEDVKKQNAEFSKHLSETESAKCHLELQLESLRNQMQKENSSFLEQYEEMQATLQKERDLLKDQLQSLVLKNTELEDTNAESQIWKTKFDALHQSFSDLQSRLESNEREVASLTSDKEKLLHESARLSEENDNLNTLLQSAEEKDSSFCTLFFSECEELKQQFSSIHQAFESISSIVNTSNTGLSTKVSEAVIQQLNNHLNVSRLENAAFDIEQVPSLNSSCDQPNKDNILQQIKWYLVQLGTFDRYLQSIASNFQSTNRLAEAAILKLDEALKASETLQAENEKLSLDVNDHASKMSKLSEELQDLNWKYRDQQQCNSTLQTDNSKLLKEVEDLTNKSEKLIEQLQETSSQLADVETRLESTTNDYKIFTEKSNSEMLLASQNLQSLANSKSDLESECHANQIQIQKLSETIGSLKNQENMLQSEKAELEKSSQLLAEQLTLSKAKTDELEEKVTKLLHIENDLTLAQEQISLFQQEMTSLVSANRGLVEKNELLENKCVNLNDVITGLKQVSDDKLSDLLTTNMDLKEHSEALEKLNQGLNTNLIELEKRVTILDEDYKALKNKCDALEDTKSKYESEIRDLNQLSEDLKSLNRDLEVELADVRSKFEVQNMDLQNKINNLEDQLNLASANYRELEEESQKSIFSLKTQLEEMGNKVPELENKLSALNEDYSALQLQTTSGIDTQKCFEEELAGARKELAQTLEMYEEKEKVLASVNEMFNESFKELENLKVSYHELESNAKLDKQKLSSDLQQAYDRISEFEAQLEMKNFECTQWQDKVAVVEEKVIKFENDLSGSIEQNLLLTKESQEKDTLISSLNTQLDEKLEELSKLTSKCDQFEKGDSSYDNISSKLQVALEKITFYEEQLQGKSDECSQLVLREQELAQLKNEFSRTVTNLNDKEQTINGMNQTLTEQIGKVQMSEERVLNILTFQNNLLHQLKSLSSLVGDETSLNPNSSLENLITKSEELDVYTDGLRDLTSDLWRILMEKHQTIVSCQKKIENFESSLNNLLCNFNTSGESPLSDVQLKGNNNVQIIEKYVAELLCENERLKQEITESNNIQSELRSQIDSALQNINLLTLQNNELETKANLVNDVVQSKTVECNEPILPQKEELALVGKSLNDGTADLQHNKEEEIQNLNGENNRLNSVIEANKIKMGKMLVKLKQLKEKSDSLTIELQDVTGNLNSEIQKQAAEIGDLQNQNKDLASRTQEMESLLSATQLESQKMREEYKQLAGRFQTSESKLQENQLELEKQRLNFENLFSEKKTLETDKHSLKEQLEIARQQCDLIASDNDTFLTLVEELKTNKKLLESEVQKLRTTVSNEHAEKSRQLLESSKEIQDLKLLVDEKDQQLKNLSQTLSDKQITLDELTEKCFKLDCELSHLKVSNSVRLAEMIVEEKCLKEESVPLRSMASDLKDQNENRKATAENLTAENSKLKTSISELENRIRKYELIEQQKLSLEQQVDDLNSQLSSQSLHSDISANEFVQKMQNQIEKLRSSVAELQTQNSNLTEKLSEFDRLKSHTYNLELERNELKNSVTQITSQFDDIRHQANVRIQELNSTSQKQTEYIQTLQTKLELLSAQRDELQRNLDEMTHQRERLEAKLITVEKASSSSDLLSAERDKIEKELAHEFEQKRVLEQNYKELHLSHHTLQANLESLNIERLRILEDLQMQSHHREQLEKELEEARIFRENQLSEKDQQDSFKSQEAMHISQYSQREEHLKLELQHAMQTIHQQGLRCEQLGLELGKHVNGQSEQQGRNPVDESTIAELQLKLETMQAERDLERHRRLLLQEEMNTNSPSTSNTYAENEYKLIIEEEPQYIPETSYLISRNVQTHWTKVHRWLLGRRNYFRNTVKKRQHFKLLFYTYVAILHIWIMLCLF